MKNTFNFWGIIALVAVIGFAMAACDNGGGGDGDNAFLGDKLEFSGQQVYTENQTGIGVSYQNFTGTLGIDDDNGGNGAITGGKLTYTIGTPTYLNNVSDIFGDTNVTISNPNVKGSWLSLDIDSNDYYALYRGNKTTKMSGNSMSGTQEQVMYMYVDGDLTISGVGKTETESEIDEDDGTVYTDTYTTKNFSLALKKGWNAVYTKYTGSQTYTATTVKSTITVSISLSNPNLKWILGGGYDDDDDDYSYSVLTPPKALKRLQRIGN
jgi:hypothetical protein